MNNNFASKMPTILTANASNSDLVSSFLRIYRLQSPSIPSNVPTACLLEGRKSSKASELMPSMENDEIYIYWDQSEELRKDLIGNVTAFWDSRNPWEDYNFCIFPESLAWCVGFTHNDYCVLVKRQ